jgi:hypothetical protein
MLVGVVDGVREVASAATAKAEQKTSSAKPTPAGKK